MSEYTDYEYLDIQVNEGVAVVTLAGPHPGNAVPLKGHEEMSTIYPRLMADDSVAAVVLTGRGDDFSAGPSMEMVGLAMKDRRAFMHTLGDEMRELVSSGVNFHKPVVTALNGPANGAPLAFAMTGDIILAEQHVSIADMHVVVAAAAGDGNTLFWPAAMGLTRAKRYLLTGDPMTAEQAAEFGLVSEVVETGTSLEKAMEFARRFVDGHQLAIQYTKRALNHYLQMAMPAQHLAWAGQLLTLTAPNADEGAEHIAEVMGANGDQPSGSGSSTASDAASEIFGDWDITAKTPMGKKQLKLQLRTDSEDQISGSFDTPVGPADLENVHAEGHKLSFSAKPGAGMTAKVSVEFDGDTVTGTMKIGPIGGAKLSGVRAAG